ncbi:ECF-type sigma factor [Marinicella sediminis]|uniref:ECF-type sigma factor n=2 Tax=Marinicella sediminis TaxID=1792834 RepID=A0ABV7JBP1_9GAMM
MKQAKQEFDQLVEATLDMLKRIARKHKKSHQHNTLQTTEIVHETYLRVIQKQLNHWPDQKEFLIHMAMNIKQFLLDQYRRKVAAKRNHGQRAESFDDALYLAVPDGHANWEELEENLEKLNGIDPQAVELVMLRYFIGYNLDEASNALQISTSTASRKWAFARSWLHAQMSEQPL